MPAYKHGVFIFEQPTSLLPPRRVEAGLPVVFGIAPVHLGDPSKVNVPELIYSYDDAVATFGFDSDLETWTLCEFIKVLFAFYAVCPCVLINVFDPATHKATETDEAQTFADGKIITAHPHVLAGEEVKNDAGDVTYVLDTDYTINRQTGVITRIDAGGIGATDPVKVTYDYADPSAVTGTDIIGGIDGSTGAKTGLELVNRVFPQFGLIPGQVGAPGWSHEPATAAVMFAKAGNINGHFKAVAVCDVPVTGAGVPVQYSEVPAWKTTNNYTDEQAEVCWPKVKIGNEVHWMSSHQIALTMQVDADHQDVPYKSPSNERLSINGTDLDGEAVWLGPDEAAYLNGQGIITPLNFGGSGWVSWGNRTGAYPGSTDPKDTFIPIRRMFNWIGNTLTTTFWQVVDFPIRQRDIDRVVDSVNVWLNGLASREMILGGKVEFRREENPVTDVMDGIVRFHVYVTPPTPAREIDFILEYDVSNLETLFA